MVNTSTSNNGIEATVLKSKYGDDIRKSQLRHQNDLNYDDLVLMMQRVYKLNSNVDVQLKYRDSEGDWITIVDDEDVAFALRSEQSQLYIEVFSGGKEVNDMVVEKKDVKGNVVEKVETEKVTPMSPPVAQKEVLDSLNNQSNLQSQQSWSNIETVGTPVSQMGSNNVELFSNSSLTRPHLL